MVFSSKGAIDCTVHNSARAKIVETVGGLHRDVNVDVDAVAVAVTPRNLTEH